MRRLFIRKIEPNEIEPYRMVKKKIAHQSCMNTEALVQRVIEPLRNLIEMTEGSPMTCNWNLKGAIVKLCKFIIPKSDAIVWNGSWRSKSL